MTISTRATHPQPDSTKEHNDKQSLHSRSMADDLKTPVPSSVSVFAQRSTVTLLVGTDEEPLIAHESYITKNSEFFQAAVKKEWAEGQTRVIKLPEDDVETMTNYLTFTYSCELPTSKLVKGHPGQTNIDWDSLAKLYVLGERILDKCVRNAITSEIVRIMVLPENAESKLRIILFE